MLYSTFAALCLSVAIMRSKFPFSFQQYPQNRFMPFTSDFLIVVAVQLCVQLMNLARNQCATKQLFKHLIALLLLRLICWNLICFTRVCCCCFCLIISCEKKELNLARIADFDRRRAINISCGK